jgi:hypothetical protein
MSLEPIKQIQSRLPEQLTNITNSKQSDLPRDGEGFLKRLSTNLVALFTVFMILIALIAIIYTTNYLYYDHPRLFNIGHSEPLDAFIMDYSQQLITNIETLRNHPSFSSVIEPLYKKGIIPPKLSEYGHSKIPIFYFYYMFEEALDSKEEKEVGLWKIMTDGITSITVNKTVWKLYNKSETVITSSAMDFLQEHVSCLVDLYNKFKNKSVLDNDDKSDPNHVKIGMAKRNLYLLFSYHDQIERAYDLRKSGGIANMKIYKIYMKDYTQFVFKERIPEILLTFLTDVQNTTMRFQKIVSGPAAQDYMTKLPMTLAGMEGFIGTYATFEPTDEVEHFINILMDIGKALMAIPKFFKSIASVVTGLVNVVTSPMKFIRFILSAIIGIILIILWILLVVVGPVVFYIVAFVVVAFERAYHIFLWVVIYLAMAIIYFILWILDFATGGLIMRALRCENLPNAWHMIPGYAFNNIYKRTFLCSSPCGKRYNVVGASWCSRLEPYQPSYCPQQIIYSAYLANSGAVGESVANSKPLIHKYKPDLAYFGMRDARKEEYLGEVFDNKLEFLKKCNGSVNEYNYINEYICENLDVLIPDIAANKDVRTKIQMCCSSAYCQFAYDDDGIEIIDPNKKPQFCKTAQLVENKAPAQEPAPSENIYMMFLFMLIIFVVCILLFMTMYAGTSPPMPPAAPQKEKKESAWKKMKDLAKKTRENASEAMSKAGETIKNMRKNKEEATSGEVPSGESTSGEAPVNVATERVATESGQATTGNVATSGQVVM